ncbi:MAG: hypothetical protein QW514_05570 [Thermoprotei archaeon]
MSTQSLKFSRKPKSLGIRSLTITISIVYGALALLAVLFNLPHHNLFTHGLQSIIGFILVQKLWASFSQSGLINTQIVNQEIQWFTGARFIIV